MPEEDFGGDAVLALPKLNLQFLTMHDYLLRNFQLFQLESTYGYSQLSFVYRSVWFSYFYCFIAYPFFSGRYQIREDVIKTCERIQPMLHRSGKTIFTGWSRMAVPIGRLAVTQVCVGFFLVYFCLRIIEHNMFLYL